MALSAKEVAGDLRVRTLLHEAPLVASYVERYWHPTLDPVSQTVVLPGLESTAKQMPREIADEIRELHALTREAQDAWLQGAHPTGADPTARGWFVLGELKSALGFLFDDGKMDTRDAQLARVQEAHAKDGSSREDLASALDDYAAVARPYADELHGLGGFDRALVDEASRLAGRLRAISETQRDAKSAARAMMQLRNRYATLLAARMERVRSTARYVFRHHPKVAQQVGSASARARAAASRKKRKKPSSPDPV